MAGVRNITARGRAILLAVVAAVAIVGTFIMLRHAPAAVAPGSAIERAVPAPPPPPPPPPPPWTTAQLRDLRDAVGHADDEGLRPADYDRDALQSAVAAHRTGADVDALANKAATALARDYAGGHIRNRHRFNWYIDYAGPDTAGTLRLVTAAREDGRLDDWLSGLLPAGRQYRALRDALAATPGEDWHRRDRIIANMERWRWLPRDFGAGDQLYVNLPTYRLAVVRDGETVADYKAVIGALDMPTPVLSATVRQVIVNPDWIVPQSIVRRSHLRPGGKYIFTRRPDGTMRVRQKPGAGNALGKVKIELPNRLAIYFHDTPSRSLFGASERAFSHGCVRVQDIETLGATLVPRPDRYRAALAGSQTRSFPVAHPWRADIVYLTLVPGDGGELTDVGDPYGMDEAMAAALEHRKPRAPAAAPVVVPAAVPVAIPAPAETPVPANTTEPAPTANVAEPQATTPPGR